MLKKIQGVFVPPDFIYYSYEHSPQAFRTVCVPQSDRIDI